MLQGIAVLSHRGRYDALVVPGRVAHGLERQHPAPCRSRAWFPATAEVTSTQTRDFFKISYQNQLRSRWGDHCRAHTRARGDGRPICCPPSSSPHSPPPPPGPPGSSNCCPPTSARARRPTTPRLVKSSPSAVGIHNLALRRPFADWNVPTDAAKQTAYLFARACLHDCRGPLARMTERPQRDADGARQSCAAHRRRFADQDTHQRLRATKLASQKPSLGSQALGPPP